jgi:hypothetical protein
MPSGCGSANNVCSQRRPDLDTVIHWTTQQSFSLHDEYLTPAHNASIGSSNLALSRVSISNDQRSTLRALKKQLVLSDNMLDRKARALRLGNSPVLEVQSLRALGNKVLIVPVDQRHHGSLSIGSPCHQLGVSVHHHVGLHLFGYLATITRRHKVLVEFPFPLDRHSRIFDDSMLVRHDPRHNSRETADVLRKQIVLVRLLRKICETQGFWHGVEAI